MNEFYAYISRLRLIRRWSLMRNTQPENDAEHSLQVAMISHALAVLARDRYSRDVDPEHVVTLAVYHDAAEVLTGDLPTPVKYHSDTLRNAYAEVERAALEKLTAMLPKETQRAISPILKEHDTLAMRIVKAADRISAYVHCLEEQRAGNREFDAAAVSILASIHALAMPEAEDFLRDCVPAFLLTLDELNRRE
ncbi:5'-deoxynucleotidase [Candidatus Saccharibacteria bacterium]|nr:5'-deoxynucleotidase [Candidatus Saccharibacteria bacterium]